MEIGDNATVSTERVSYAESKCMRILSVYLDLTEVWEEGVWMLLQQTGAKGFKAGLPYVFLLELNDSVAQSWPIAKSAKPQ